MNMKPFTTQLYSRKATKYVLGISNKKSLIDQQRNTIDITPGKHISIEVLPRLVKTTKDFNELDRNQRKCKLPHETDGLLFLKEYSRIGCEVECAAKRAMLICKCLPWYYTSDFKAAPICEMFGGFCFEVIMADARYYRQCKEQCLPDCYETEYLVYSSRTPLDLDSTCKAGGFHQNNFEKSIKKHFAFHNYKTLVEGGSIPDLAKSLGNGSLCKNYIGNYVSFVSVESGTTRILSTNKDRRIFFHDQLRTFGGTLGLFASFSVISIFELCFLLYNLATAFIRKSKTDPADVQEDNDKVKLKKLEYGFQVSFCISCPFTQILS